MILKRWNELPESFKNDAVKPYYDVLNNKKASLAAKRAFDVMASSAMIVVISPALAGISVAIKKDDGGPVFFRQERVTQYGRRFRIFKFRTMIVNAESKGAQVTSQNDSRITAVGGKLRKYRLDELPQLFNIFTGDMTFVGTRPEVPKYVEKYSNEMMATLLLPAGVTSEASIMYKDEDEILGTADNPDEIYVETILPEKMKFNLEEIKNFALIRETKTLVRTVFAVLK